MRSFKSIQTGLFLPCMLAAVAYTKHTNKHILNVGTWYHHSSIISVLVLKDPSSHIKRSGFASQIYTIWINIKSKIEYVNSIIVFRQQTEPHTKWLIPKWAHALFCSIFFACCRSAEEQVPYIQRAYKSVRYTLLTRWWVDGKERGEGSDGSYGGNKYLELYLIL